MTTFLERILATKRREVAQLKTRGTTVERTSRSSAGRFVEAVTAGTQLAIVSEIKKASPSKGLIQPAFDPVATAQAYEQAGAAAVSVLTDETFFQGSIHHLEQVQQHVAIPVLRKDFIIDPVQIDEASRAGADAILLIVAALDSDKLKTLSAYAQDLCLDVLIEVHSGDELPAALDAGPSVLGINNRNLHTFEVSLSTTLSIMEDVPDGIPVIAESGVHTHTDAEMLARAGVHGLLVGESLMRQTSHHERQRLLQSFAVPRQADFVKDGFR